MVFLTKKRLKMKKKYYVFVRYEKIYPLLFEKLKKKLLKDLDNLAKISKIEHVGSSSVPGLGGKGMIDILIAVPKNKMKLARDLLIKKGYFWDKEYDGDERYFFRKNYLALNKKREMHVSITFEKSNQIWKSAISTRNYLRNHPNEAKKYEKIKEEGTKRAKGEGKVYRRYKSNFLKILTKKAIKNNE
jgi:GrpB-like predicted nucleotidyltransferase (UPF0157 family)